ncbi:chromate efflux transporter [Marinovum sp. 2_MG-2023]|uniref:chromate efflux transporter n=1 Tax=unclassified Marinovum TaxID=2647166 RepID=UPI0026E20E9D|nr:MULTISPECIES: chromate efflux transporter [unclassified Marinovum]MDO6729472.1 chromate efflux transporter [Marinovum sp. 2_MG-2023]MDO6780375.1 chromate efflux transporter [Marinovum sp. 1_MG-2023]
MSISNSALLHAFGRIGLLSFGGPAAQIAVMHRELVDDRKWLTEEQFLRALSFCMMLPGPEAMQLATYAGWRLRGTFGGVLAGLLFVLPGAFVIAALAAIYIRFGDVGLVQTLFVGIKAAVIVIVAQALWRLSKKALKDGVAILLAGAAFVGLFLFQLPFPLIVGLAALFGATRANSAPTPEIPARAGRAPLLAVPIWGALWLIPLIVLWALNQDFLLNLSLFFGKLALVTFGGAYAVLAYMTQEVVQAQGWITTPEMIDALGLAETTPGPLILVTQFVGHLAGFHESGWGGMILAGFLALWMTFTPCFLWIFAGAPYLEQITTRPRIGAALTAVTAAVVGVIANLSIWFALNVWFAQATTWDIGPVHLLVPDWHSLSPAAVILTGLAAICIFWGRLAVPLTLLICAFAAWGLTLVTGM